MVWRVRDLGREKAGRVNWEKVGVNGGEALSDQEGRLSSFVVGEGSEEALVAALDLLSVLSDGEGVRLEWTEEAGVESEGVVESAAEVVVRLEDVDERDVGAEGGLKSVSASSATTFTWVGASSSSSPSDSGRGCSLACRK